MAKDRTGYVLKTFNDSDTAEENLVRRGDEITTSESRFKELERAGMVSSDKPPARSPGRPAPGRSTGQRGPRRTQERQGRQTQDEGDVSDDELESALATFQRAGIAPGSVQVSDLREAADRRAAFLAENPNAEGLTTLGEEFEQTGQGRTQRADGTAEGDGSSKPADPPPGETGPESTTGSSEAGEPITTGSIPAAAADATASPPADAPRRPSRGNRAGE